MPVRAVLFDLGNTLWHIPEPPPVERVRRETVGRILALLRSWGIEPDGHFHFLGRDIRLAITEADLRAYEGDCLSPHFPSLVREVAASHGLELSPESAQRLWETWNLEGAFFGRRLFDDALETLAALRERGLQIACVTNRPFAGPAFHAELGELGLAACFDALAVSCDLGYMKPHPEIYRHALEQLATGPQETVMVGDSLRADVAGAQALGMTAVWRRPRVVREELDGARPDFAVDDLRELLALPCLQPDGLAPTT